VKAVGRRIIAPRGVGPTGFGVGALIGTYIATKSEKKEPKRILFTGDGGLMNGGINEFETIKKLNFNCTIVVINNSALGYVKFGQAMLFKKRYYHTDRPDTNFAKIGEAFGFNTFRVENLSNLDTTIKEAINGDGPQLVDVVVDKMELLPPNFY
jgi:acetolactate synthase-1/2/3 large subunit